MLNIEGDKLYQQRARQALPILVRQAIASQPIIYSDLAVELKMPNPRNLNHVLGAVGDSVQSLAKEWQTEIPPIQFLVCQKYSGVPGKGVYAKEIPNYTQLKLWQKRYEVQRLHGKIFAYDRWHDVLKHFSLLPAPPAATPKVIKRAARSLRMGAGESPAHKALKKHVADRPALVGLSPTGLEIEVEAQLPSGDKVDVLFQNNKRRIAVEVKAANAPDDDLLRGLFQCVKYRSVLTALIAIEGKIQAVDAILVLERKLPPDLVKVRNTLGVKVIEGVKPKK